MSGTDAVIPPGWYTDEQVPGGQRWWDGLAWTEYRKSPAEVAQSAASSPLGSAPAPYSIAAPLAPAAVPIIDPVAGQVPLWAPLYGATFGQAWKRFWRKYADFTGRASRSEFWWAYLGVVITVFAAYFLLLFVSLGGFAIASNSDIAVGTGLVAMLLSMLLFAGYIALILPLISISVRRLHDAGYPGTYYLLGFIPIAGGIILLVYLASESKPQGAIYDRPTS